MYAIEDGIERPAPADTPEDFPFELLTDDRKFFFVPASIRASPKQARARVYHAARQRGFKIHAHHAVKDGIPGFRIYRAFTVTGGQKPNAEVAQ